MVAVALAMLLWPRFRKRTSPGPWPAPFAFSLILLGVTVFLVTEISRPLWERVSVIQYFEFPWRFLILAALATPLIVAWVVARAPERVRLRLAAVVVVALVLYHFPRAWPETFHDVNEADYAPDRIAARDIAVTTCREYEPVWVTARPPMPPPARLMPARGRVRILQEKIEPFSRFFDIETEVPTRIRASTFYYPGWTVRVDGEDRTAEPVNEYGLIEFDVEAGRHEVSLRFQNTPLRTASLVGSAIVFLGLAALGWVLLRRRGRESEIPDE
jgi:hypothetical protein